MRLSDIMGAMQLSSYAQVALALFVLAFAAIIYQVFRPANCSQWERASRVPFDEESGPSSLPAQGERSVGNDHD